VELDASRALARWMARHRRALADILEHGTWLDRHDVDGLLELAVPGIDELIGLIEIVRLASAGPGYDDVVVDTAPTGHALRLLASPQAVQSLVALLDTLQRDHRIIRQQLAGVGRPDAADRLIAALEHDAVETRELLRDRTRASFHWVMLPEQLAAAETADALRALERLGVIVDEIVVNRVTPAGPPCPVCDPRRAAEARVLTTVRRLSGRREIRLVAAEVNEPRGAAALLRIGAGPKARTTNSADLKARRTNAARTKVAVVRTFRSAFPLTMTSLAGTRLLFVGGKGGVGKTTVAAAIALRLARTTRAANILLLSTDPAHSVGDVLGIQASDIEGPATGGPGNLHVRELDAPAALAAKRGGLEASLQSLADALGSAGVGAMVNRSLTELVELAPPGLDELMGVLSVLEARSRYAVVVVDTAPTGHALRLLEMPAVAREWVQALLRMLLKYRKLLRPGALAGDLVDFSRQVRTLQSLLTDATATRFVAVTRAAELPRLETGRLLAKLRRMRVATPFVIVNALTPPTDLCPRCRTTRAGERRELKRLARLCRDYRCAIIQAPLAVPPPRGIRPLERWGRGWIV
jgi:arsenite-transporting ATPase